jgi:hypothetical protein
MSTPIFKFNKCWYDNHVLTARDLLTEHFLKWQYESGESKKQADFAAYIGESEKYLSMVMNGRKESRRQAIHFAEFFNDPRFYDAYPMDRPEPITQFIVRTLPKAPEKTKRRIAQELAEVNKRISNYTKAIGELGISQALKDALRAAEEDRARLEYKLEQDPVAPAALTLPRTTLETLAAQLKTMLQSDDLDQRKSALRQIIDRILVRRTDAELRTLIEYHLPETKLPP